VGGCDKKNGRGSIHSPSYSCDKVFKMSERIENTFIVKTFVPEEFGETQQPIVRFYLKSIPPTFKRKFHILIMGEESDFSGDKSLG
jgi:hypothetical protein